MKEARTRRALGHINFRCKPETHAALLRAAEVLGTDLSGVMNQVLKLGLPALVEKAEQVARAWEKMQGSLEADQLCFLASLLKGKDRV